MGVGSIAARVAVFFDRDGVLNKAIVRDGKPYPPRTEDELELEPGAREALSRLRTVIPHFFVVSNQPDVARGLQTAAGVEALNDRLARELPIDHFYVCYHDETDACDCRKPLPGLIERAAREHSLELVRSYLVGDRWQDIDAGAAAGCTTVFIDRNYSERAPAHAPHYRVATLTEAVETIMGIERSRGNGASAEGAVHS